MVKARSVTLGKGKAVKKSGEIESGDIVRYDGREWDVQASYERDGIMVCRLEGFFIEGGTLTQRVIFTPVPHKDVVYVGASRFVPRGNLPESYLEGSRQYAADHDQDDALDAMLENLRN